MKNKLIIILLIAITVCSCRTTKRMSSSSFVSAKDSLKATQLIVNTSAAASFQTRTVRDTVISIPIRAVRDTLSASDLMPVTSSDGIAIAHTSFLEGKGISIRTIALPSGQVIIEGNCDSMSIILKGYMEEAQYWHEKHDNLLVEFTDLKSVETQSDNISISKSASGLKLWVWIIILALTVVLIITGIRNFF